MRFLSIDVETANADMASICSIGAALFEGEKLVSEWYSLIDPDDYFDELNVSIHGISEKMVKNSPTYGEVAGDIHKLMDDAVVVTHTHFDRVAMQQAAHRWEIEHPECTWLDSARVARRTWPQCAKSGYGLASVCKQIGYEFQHHHALEDAQGRSKSVVCCHGRN